MLSPPDDIEFKVKKVRDTVYLGLSFDKDVNTCSVHGLVSDPGELQRCYRDGALPSAKKRDPCAPVQVTTSPIGPPPSWLPRHRNLVTP